MAGGWRKTSKYSQVTIVPTISCGDSPPSVVRVGSELPKIPDNVVVRSLRLRYSVVENPPSPALRTAVMGNRGLGVDR